MTGCLKIIFAFTFLFSVQTAQANWQRIPSGTFAWLRSIHFVNEQRGFIVGGNGSFLQTVDGGRSWVVKRRFTDDAIVDVYFRDEKSGWLLCERDIYALSSASPSYLMHTQDGGETWTRIEARADRNRMTRMFFSNRGNGFAVGEGGALISLRNGTATWKESALPVRYLMLDGSFFDEENAVVVGGGGTILNTADGGISWKESSVYGKTQTKLNAVFVFGKTSGWSVGANGKILMTLNGGKIWHAQNSGTTRDLLDVVFTSTSEGWAFGDTGTILHTKTAGNIWNEIENSSRHRIERAVFVGQRGFAVGFGGTILAYDPNHFIRYVNRPKPILKKRN